jgi:hypothetical protein
MAPATTTQRAHVLELLACLKRLSLEAYSRTSSAASCHRQQNDHQSCISIPAEPRSIWAQVEVQELGLPLMRFIARHDDAVDGGEANGANYALA